MVAFSVLLCAVKRELVAYWPRFRWPQSFTDGTREMQLLVPGQSDAHLLMLTGEGLNSPTMGHILWSLGMWSMPCHGMYLFSIFCITIFFFFFMLKGAASDFWWTLLIFKIIKTNTPLPKRILPLSHSHICYSTQAMTIAESAVPAGHDVINKWKQYVLQC